MARGLSTEGLQGGNGLSSDSGGLYGNVTPLDSPNCAFWLDANNAGSLTIASGRATAVRDSGGSAITFTPPGSGPQWTENVNAGRAGLLMYDSATSRYISAADTALLDYSTFHGLCVIKRAGDMAATEHVMGKYTTTGNQRENRVIILSGDGLQGVASDTSGGIGGQTASLVTPNSLGTIANGAVGILEYFYDGTNVGVSLNNEAPVTIAMTGPMFNGTSPFTFGAREAAGDPGNFYLLEAAFFTKSLSAKHRMIQLRSLAARHRITLS